MLEPGTLNGQLQNGQKEAVMVTPTVSATATTGRSSSTPAAAGFTSLTRPVPLPVNCSGSMGSVPQDSSGYWVTPTGFCQVRSHCLYRSWVSTCHLTAPEAFTSDTSPNERTTAYPPPGTSMVLAFPEAVSSRPEPVSDMVLATDAVLACAVAPLVWAAWAAPGAVSPTVSPASARGMRTRLQRMLLLCH